MCGVTVLLRLAEATAYFARNAILRLYQVTHYSVLSLITNAMHGPQRASFAPYGPAIDIAPADWI